MKISTRHILKGEIVGVVKGATTAHVKTVNGTTATASIANEAVDTLKLEKAGWPMRSSRRPTLWSPVDD